MAAVKGRLRDITETLYGWLDTVLTANYASYKVIPNPRFSVNDLATMPLVTMKVDSGLLDDLVFGRKTPEDGSNVTYSFNLHIHQKKNTDGNDHNYDVQVCATHIIKYLKTKDQNTTEMADHGIWRVADIGGRESDLQGTRNVARIIVTGIIEVTREDSP